MARKRGWKIARLGIMTVAMVLAVTLACYASTVTGLAVKKINEKVEIHINANGPLYYNVESKAKPRQALVIKLTNGYAIEKALKTIQIDKGIIERAKLKRCEDGKAKLVLEVLQPVKYYVKAAPGNRGLILIVSTQTITAQASKAVPEMGTEEPTAEGPEPVKPPKTMAKAEYPKPYQHKNLRAKKKKKVTKPVKLVSLDFVNADLVYVLKLLAKELDVNLVTDQSVTGAVTMSLKNVSAQTAMNIIVRMNGFKMKKMGNILFVGSEETMNMLTPDVIEYQPTGDVKVATIQLDYLSPEEAKQTIKASYPLVQVQTARSAIIVHANEKMLTEIQNVVQGIDVPAPEAPVAPSEVVEVVRLKYATATDLSSTLKNLMGEDAPATMEVDKRLNAIVMKGYESQIEKAKGHIEDLDVPLQQVMISVKVVDLSESGSKNLGMTWQVGSEDGTQPIQWYEVPDGYPAAQDDWDPYEYSGDAQSAGSPIGFFVRDPFVLRTALSLQIAQGEAKVLASPRVAALSGEEATLHIGDKYPIVYYDPRAGQYQVIYVDIGIKMTVTPEISPDGFITTEIETTVSNLAGLINNQYPQTTERSASLTVRVKDNNTIVLGGMLSENSTVDVTKVPLLGDIPVIGHFFRSTSESKKRGEVVIMLTPKIIND